MHGLGVPQNCSLAALYYELAADAHASTISIPFPLHVPRLARLGADEHDDGGASDEAVRLRALDSRTRSARRRAHPALRAQVLEYFFQQAGYGTPNAQAALGHLHYAGVHGAPRQPAAAQTFFRQAAEQARVPGERGCVPRLLTCGGRTGKRAGHEQSGLAAAAGRGRACQRRRGAQVAGGGSADRGAGGAERLRPHVRAPLLAPRACALLLTPALAPRPPLA